MRVAALVLLIGCYRDAATPPATGTSAPQEPSSLIGAIRPASYEEVQAVAISRLIPMTQWTAVPGRTIGVVLAQGPQAWGTSINYARDFDDGHEQGYVLSRDGGSNLPLEWKTTHDEDRHAYVAELVLDHGRGASGSSAASVTKVTVLDRTDAVWFDTEAALRQLRKRFESAIAAHADALAAAMVERHDRLEDETRERQFGARPVWLADEKQLEVLFVVRDVHSGTTYGYGAVTRRRDPTLLASPPPPEPMQYTHGAAMAARYTIDTHGKLVGETVFLPASFTAGRGYSYGQTDDDWYGQ